MKIKIHSIQNHGDSSKEYVALEALEDCEIGNYAIVDTTYTSNGKVLSNKWRHFHRFGAQLLKKGDFVMLYTRIGRNSSESFLRKDTQQSVMAYHRYWGLESSVWNDGGDCAALYYMRLIHAKKKK